MADVFAAPESFSAAVPFRILTVCTMNICRSPALEIALDRQPVWAQLPVGTVVISSAGTEAHAGAPSCDVSLAMIGEQQRTERSRQLTTELLTGVDLILTAGRTHADAVVGLAPEVRSVCFRARAAARLAEWVVQDGALDIGRRRALGQSIEPDRRVPQTFAGVLPLDAVARLRWLVAEMDAARGLPSADAAEPSEAFERDDIPDPHVLGYGMHRMSADFILDSTDRLAAAVAAVLD